MKMLIAGLALLASAVAPAPAAPVNYSGHWTLDAARSRNLPPFYARVKSHVLDVTQDAAHLTVAVAIDIGEGEPDRISLPYSLDGQPVRTETLVRTPRGPMSVPTTLLATVDEAGAVHIAITRRVETPDGARELHGSEVWELSPDGRTLTVHRRDEMPQGTIDSDMVFARG
jgi:hypothetical protein